MKIQKINKNKIILTPSIGELFVSSFMFLISIFLLDFKVLISVIIFLAINLLTGFFLLKRSKFDLNNASGELTIRRYIFYFFEFKKVMSNPSNFKFELIDSETKIGISYVYCSLSGNEINLGTLESKEMKKTLKKSLIGFGVDI